MIMKGTDHFKEIISAYLDRREAEDTQFAERRRAVNRSVDDIVTYILNEVRTSGCCGFSDEEIFGMAVHAAEEAEINIRSEIKGNVIVNRHIELTEEEKEEQHQMALRRYQEEELRKIRERNIRPKATAKPQTEKKSELSLFDM